MAQNSIATAADYADAMLTARRAKNWLVSLLLVMLVVQLGLFLAARFTGFLAPRPVATAQPTTAPAAPQPTAQQTPASTVARLGRQGLEYLIGLTGFLGIVLVLVLAIVLLLLVQIMLVGRLIGVSLVAASFVWSVVLAALLFPWQAFLNNADLTAVDFKIPGVLYTWNELVHDAAFAATDIPTSILKWSRFVVFPVLAVVLLLLIQAKSRRGLRLALGEAQLEEPPPELPAAEPPDKI